MLELPEPTRRAFRRNERRYLAGDTEALSALLTKRLGTPATYGVHTTYYVRVSKKGEHRIRVRTYNDEPVVWVEAKRRADGLVLKRRTTGRTALAAWQRTGAVAYDRSAWEAGDLRVTLDRGVHSEEGGVLGQTVLEVKGPRVPKWLRAALPDRARGFSKRRWVIGQIEPSSLIASA